MSQEISDNYLVERVKKGNRQAFRLLVERYKDPSMALAVSILKDEAIAEDVLQEAFMKVYKNIGRFRMEAAFATWLYRIVVNTGYNALARNKNRGKNESLEAAENYGQADAMPLKVEDQRKYVNLALKRMNADEALVLRLFYLYERQIPEVREITGFSESKVKVCLHRGRKNLLQELKKLLGNDINYLL